MTVRPRSSPERSSSRDSKSFDEPRFERLSRIGQGGMGAVYHAVDRWRGTRVALKSVGRCEGDRLLRFKREFRSLCDVDHPNLVRLGELFEEDGEWFFTMELVDGLHFLDYVRGDEHEPPGAATTGSEATTTDSGSDTTVDTPRASAPPTSAEDRLALHRLAATRLPFDEIRLRRALAQMVQAVAALHALSKVHRDIKPSNVLVTREGRVVLIDFGLVTELKDGRQATDVAAIGSVGYMAPEQAESRPVDVRCDWYSVGVVLFEALTGTLPFEGSAFAMMALKVANDPPRPSSRRPDIPPDLDDLCFDLLARRPEDRPSEKEIFRRLFIEHDKDPAASRTRSSAMSFVAPFVGRARELAVLGERASAVLAGSAESVLLHGESGIGKTALLDRFVRSLEIGDTRWLVLRGRCAPRESVPFHALDEVVDQLSGHLAKRPKDEVARLSPPNASLLTRTFPVLRRIDTFDSFEKLDALAPHEQRARVFGALRELLRRIAATRPVLLAIEDLQWIDADSAALLAELLRRPGEASMLFVGTARTATDASRPDLHPTLVDTPLVRVSLGRLSKTEGRELALEILHEHSDSTVSLDEELLEAADGHPLFLEEMLVRTATTGHGRESTTDLDRVLRARIAELPDAARGILHVLAVAGHPVPFEVLAQTTDLEPAEVERRAARLRIERLVRHGTTSARIAYEPYHGRIRDAVLSMLSADEVRTLHGRIARRYEALQAGTPDLLALHFRESGEVAAAARYAERAARKAIEALAFEHAADLFRTALTWEVESGHDRPDLRIAYAEALANAGRGEDAADAFLDASGRTAALEAIDLRRRAGEQLMLSGRFDRGTALFRDLLREVHERIVDGPIETLVSLLWLRFRRWLRGKRFVERHESELAPDRRLRYDVVHSMAVGLVPMDSLRGARFIVRAHLLALDLGEPSRLARMIIYSIAESVAFDPKNVTTARAALVEARSLAEKGGDPSALALTVYCDGLVSHLAGEWGSELEPLLRADRMFREECPKPPVEFRTLQAIIPHAYYETGRWNEMRERCSRAMREAHELGDLMMDVNMHCMYELLLGCMEDDPGRALDDAADAMKRWSIRGSNQDASFMEGSVTCALYDGRPADALAIVEEHWPLLRAGLVIYIQIMRIRALRTRVLVRLHLAAVETRDRSRHVRAANADIRRLRRERTKWSRAIADEMEASRLAIEGRADRAAALFDSAARGFEALGMLAYAATSRRRRGELLGDAGEALVAECDAFLASQGVRNPGRMANAIAPPSGPRTTRPT